MQNNPLSEVNVRRLWEGTIRDKLGDFSYFAGKKWDTTFKKAAKLFQEHPDINPSKYILAQVEEAIKTGRLAYLFPNWLLGPNAMARYKARSSESDSLATWRRDAEIHIQGFIQSTDREKYLRSVVTMSPTVKIILRTITGLPIDPQLVSSSTCELENFPSLTAHIQCAIQGAMHDISIRS